MNFIDINFNLSFFSKYINSYIKFKNNKKREE